MRIRQEEIANTAKDMLCHTAYTNLSLLRRKPNAPLHLGDQFEQARKIARAPCVDQLLLLRVDAPLRHGEEDVDRLLNVNRELELVDAFSLAVRDASVIPHLRSALESSKSDEQILEFCMAAIVAEGESVLESIASELLTSPLGKDRALAVSMLAFCGTETAVETLKSLRTRDASRWVRTHTDWATNVCRSELHCRQHYRHALSAASDEDCFRHRALIRPALLPMASCWRGRIESEKGARSDTSPTRRMMLLRFWRHVESTGKSSIEVYQRRLKQYHRGEKLDTSLASRMSPWWRP